MPGIRGSHHIRGGLFNCVDIRTDVLAVSCSAKRGRRLVAGGHLAFQPAQAVVATRIQRCVSDASCLSVLQHDIAGGPVSRAANNQVVSENRVREATVQNSSRS